MARTRSADRLAAHTTMSAPPIASPLRVAIGRPARSAISSRLAVPLGAACVLGGVAAAHGGYFPTAWNWTSLALLWLASLALALRPRIALSRAEVIVLIGLFVLTGWTALSLLWSQNPGASIEETQRTLVYVAGALALALGVDSRRVGSLMGGAVIAIGAVCAYGLATRLFPDRFGYVAPFAGYRLFAPLGYWNALGAFAAIGLLLAAGIALRGHRPHARCAAAALLPILAATQYFTFSRGAAIALACGLGAAIAVETRRLALAGGMLTLGLPAALAVWLGANSPGMIHELPSPTLAAHDGHRLAVAIVALCAVSAALALALSHVQAHVHVGERARKVSARGALAALLVGIVVLFAALGTPWSLAQRAWGSFTTQPVHTTSLNQRLLTLSGSGRAEAWRIAINDFAQHPVAGSGAGTYQDYWLAHRRSGGNLRDAHNLYLETAAELGAVGLMLLLIVLAAPLAVLARARHHPLASAAAGAFVVFLVHAAGDWDWEMPAVSLAGLLAGLSLLVIARKASRQIKLGWAAHAGVLAAVLATAAFAFVGLRGHTAEAASAAALDHGRSTEAQRLAREAAAWEPWSSRPWQLIASARFDIGDLAGAARYDRLALRQDPNNWELWFDLGYALDGRAADAAFAHARKLDPLNSEIPTTGS